MWFSVKLVVNDTEEMEILKAVLCMNETRIRTYSQGLNSPTFADANK
jgi:hypothetical protein